MTVLTAVSKSVWRLHSCADFLGSSTHWVQCDWLLRKHDRMWLYASIRGSLQFAFGVSQTGCGTTGVEFKVLPSCTVTGMANVSLVWTNLSVLFHAPLILLQGSLWVAKCIMQLRAQYEHTSLGSGKQVSKTSILLEPHKKSTYIVEFWEAVFVGFLTQWYLISSSLIWLMGIESRQLQAKPWKEWVYNLLLEDLQVRLKVMFHDSSSSVLTTFY